MFDPFSADFWDDPYDTYRKLRDEAPVYHNPELGFWALSRHADVLAAHLDWKALSSTHGVTIDQLTGPDIDYSRHGSIIVMDPPEHDRMRRLVSKAFTPRGVAEFEPVVRRVVRGYLEPFDGTGEFDAVADFAAPFPIEVVSTILGVPRDDRQQVRRWTDEMLHRDPGEVGPTERGIEAAMFSAEYFLGLVAEKRARPADDLMSLLCSVEIVDDDGETRRLDDDQIAAFVTVLAAAGSETVTKLVGNGVVLFDRNPGEWAKVREDPSRIGDAVEEILRFWAPSQYQGRYAVAPVELHGVTIPPRSPVLLLTGSANRDERAFEDPDRFDIDRPPHLALGFGHGIHLCLGSALARLESRVAFEELRSRWSHLAVDESGLERVHMTNVAGFSRVPVSGRAA